MEEKKAEFTKWVDGQLDDATGQSVRTEWRIIRSLCDADLWHMHIKQRDITHCTALHVSKDLPKDVRDPLAMQFAVTTQAIRKMREMGVSQ